MSKFCYIVQFESWDDNSEICAFWDLNDAKDFVKHRMNELLDDIDCYTECDRDDFEILNGEFAYTIYKPNTDMYYEWEIVGSTIE